MVARQKYETCSKHPVFITDSDHIKFGFSAFSHVYGQFSHPAHHINHESDISYCLITSLSCVVRWEFAAVRQAGDVEGHRAD